MRLLLTGAVALLFALPAQAQLAPPNAGLGISFGLGGIVYAGFDVLVTTGMTSISNVSTNSVRNRSFTAQTHVGFGIF